MKTITPFDIESYPELSEYKDGYKDFLKKKLTVSLSCQDPLWKTKEMKSTTQDANFYRQNINRMTGRSFYVNVSWRFGDLKSAIKKVKRGISNDDMKSGGSGQSTEGGGA